MEEFLPIINYVSRHISLTEEDKEYYASLLRLKKVKKKQYIVQPDFVCNHRTYIVKGAMRSFLIDADGQDHTVALGIDDWWIADFNSFFYRQPATLFVEALEDSTLIQISYDDEQKLLEERPRFEKFYRILAQNGYAHLQKRILSDISLKAADRYENFLSRYPALAARIPQYALASYLGISHELLSKIRNKRAKKS
ncbi:Crp/Fnr family transcriptional regulator [Niastella koreensis]|uniref:Crp/Fnr family transcriptional regulator n=2 Tax=Niastella koreensis TaxID=354356 RepID=A0ABX3NNY1_9BACT|nr:Crp/Fnr family transcriptional regulator [Niastella koreensis]AEW01103.1 putative transcriptional regulator, Crp/Fnr family [Niastella koreensis GR20-10]OQP41821.1 Crp/Fnr family transcriptional regulator [Niastella koreensis]